MSITSKILFASVFAGLASAAGAVTLTSFAALDSATADETIAAGEFSNPWGANDTLDMTFDFVMTTDAALTNNAPLIDFGGVNGTSLIVENSRLIFRSNDGGNNMYVASATIAASTQYRVTGTIKTTASAQEIRLYIDESQTADVGYAGGYKPSIAVASYDWSGGNDSGYGEIGGGGILVGTAASPTSTGFLSGDPFPGTLDTDVNVYYDTYLAVPEPSTYALLFGGLALGLAMIRRRRS